MYKPGTINGTEPVNNNNGDTLGVTNPTSTVANAVSGISGIASDALNATLQPLLDALPGIGIKVGIFMLALMLIIVGFWVIAGNGQS